MPGYEVIRIGGGLPVRCPEFGSLSAPELPEGLDPKQYAVRPAGDPKWREREMARFVDGTYKRVPWPDWVLWELESKLPDHYLHISVKDPTKVSYTETPEKGEIDRQSAPMLPGRYLERFARHWSRPQQLQFYEGGTREGLVPEGEPWLDAKQIRQYAAMLLPPDPLKFATTPDEIERVYVEGPNSCMSHGANSFDSSCHPVRVYGAGDLAVAYLAVGGTISGRALCWPEKKLYGRIYGDEHRMEVALSDAGYTYGSLAGAKLLKIEDEDGIVCPYIDRDGYVEDCGDHLRISRHGGLDAQYTNGLLQERGDPCECCATPVADEDALYLRDTRYCERCYDSNTFYCDGYDERYHNDDYAGGCEGIGAICQDYYDAYCYTCDHTDRIYVTEDNPPTDVDGETWGPRAVSRDAVQCEREDTWHRRDNTVTLKDTGETVSLDWADANATEVDGEWYETAPETAAMEAA
jgi:hypothetical protein